MTTKTYEAKRMNKKDIQKLCKEHRLYQTPELNDVLYLHYQGYDRIECLEEYTGLKCLWLNSNAISEIVGLSNQPNLKCLFLQENLIKKIENLDLCPKLDMLNLSHNHIKHIDNCGVDVLPELSTLDLSYNYLRTSESVSKLRSCLTLSVLDISHNRIDDILVVKVLSDMPDLKVLTLTGNPVVNMIPQYRKTLILECKKLCHLDSRPISERDRACAVAWKQGGYEAEREELAKWNKRERDKIYESVIATLRLRDQAKYAKMQSNIESQEPDDDTIPCDRQTDKDIEESQDIEDEDDKFYSLENTFLAKMMNEEVHDTSSQEGETRDFEPPSKLDREILEEDEESFQSPSSDLSSEDSFVTGDSPQSDETTCLFNNVDENSDIDLTLQATPDTQTIEKRFVVDAKDGAGDQCFAPVTETSPLKEKSVDKELRIIDDEFRERSDVDVIVTSHALGVSDEQTLSDISCMHPCSTVSCEQLALSVSYVQTAIDVSSAPVALGISSDQLPLRVSHEQPAIIDVSGEHPVLGVSIEQQAGVSIEQPTLGVSTDRLALGVLDKQPALDFTSEQLALSVSYDQAPIDASMEQLALGVSDKQPALDVAVEPSAISVSSNRLALGVSDTQPALDVSGEQPALCVLMDYCPLDVLGQQPALNASSDLPTSDVGREQLAFRNPCDDSEDAELVTLSCDDDFGLNLLFSQEFYLASEDDMGLKMLFCEETRGNHTTASPTPIILTT